jgi:heavy metal efflux system protein
MRAMSLLAAMLVGALGGVSCHSADAPHATVEPEMTRRQGDAIEVPAASPLRARLRVAALSVARPMFIATAIIITAYLPLFAVQRVEKKLFSPMAYTVGYALFGAVMVALTLVPGVALAAFAKPVKLPHNPALALAEKTYRAVLGGVLRRPLRALVPAALGALLAVVLAGAVGKAFLPELDEGSLWLQVQLPPGISLARGATMANELRAALRESPEITHGVTQPSTVSSDASTRG